MNPAIEFEGVRIYAERNGTRVSGRVEFPYPEDREPVPIAYERPEQPDARRATDHKVTRRQEAVSTFLTAAKNCGRTRTKVTRQIASQFGVSPRTLQVWVRRFEIEGEQGLLDRQDKPAQRLRASTPEDAQHAVLICAWWAFRIGNCRVIDSGMISDALTLISAGHQSSHIISIIDFYYQAISNPAKYPYKSFHRWAKYDFKKWIYRANDVAEVRRGRELLNTQAIRRREVNHAARRASAAVDLDRHDEPPLNDCQSVAGAIGTLSAIGMRQTAHRILRHVSRPSGYPGRVGIEHAIADIDDTYRYAILDAATGNRAARAEAIATMPLWWDDVEQSVRNDIDFRVDAWRKEHHVAHTAVVCARRADMLISKIRC